MTQLATLNQLRSYLSEISPVDHDAAFQRLEKYTSSSLPVRSGTKPPTTYSSGVPVINTRSPGRVPPSARNQTVHQRNFDIGMVNMTRNSYTVQQLKDIARDLGLPETGKKADLVERIRKAWNGQAKISAK